MFKELMNRVKNFPKSTVVIPCPEHQEIIETILTAVDLDLCEFVLFGNQEKILLLFNQIEKVLPKEVLIINSNDQIQSCREAVIYVRNNENTILMKGFIDTSILLKEVVNRDYGLRTNSILSHVMVCKLPKFNRFLLLTDGAMNINPLFDDMIAIINNAVELAKRLDILTPRVAVLSAVEKANLKMPSSIKAQEVAQYFQDNTDFYVQGPLALDGAIDEHAAKIKNLNDSVSGKADILVGAYIEVINTLYKSWVFGFDGMESGGIVLGAKASIVLVSRADSITTKINSLLLAILNSNKEVLWIISS